MANLNGETMAESLENNKNIFEQIEKKYAPEVRNILEAVKTAYDLPWTTVEDADDEKVWKARDSENPYVREVVNTILGARDVDKDSTLNTYISDKLADLTTWITTNESKKGTPATKSMIHSFGPNLVKEAVTDIVRNTLSNDKTMASLAEKIGGSEGRKVSQYFKKYEQLPAYAKLAIRQYVPEGLEKYKDPETGETKTRRTYEPITDKNVKEWFSDKDRKTLKDILRERDLDKPIPRVGMQKLGDLNLADFIHSKDEVDKQGKADFSNRTMLDHAFGKLEYGHYDEGGVWREGVPNLEGNYTVKDKYDWGRDQESGLGPVLSLIKAGFTKPEYIDRSLLEAPLQMTGALTKRKEGRDIEFTVPTYKNDPMALMNVMSSRLGPYTGSDNKTVTPLGQGDLPGFGWQEDAFMGDMPDANEDPGYYDEDIDLRGGGQISQGLDNLYMKKRNEPKEKLYHMMGYKERQYGGGLDDAYMNRRRSSAFAAPNATSAFASPMSQGGLPTIYREAGGGADYKGAAEDYADMAAQEEFSSYYSDPANIDVEGSDTYVSDYFTDPGLAQGVSGIAPPAPTSDDEIDITGFPTDPNVGVFGRPLRTPEQIKSRLSGRRPEDGYTRVEYTYLNDIMDKTGMTLNQAENYLASVMATPGGIAAMEQGFHGDYTGGGPAGTLDNFVRGVGADLGLQEIAAREKRRKADPYDDFGVKERDDSFIGSIKDTVSRFFQGNRGITTEEGKEEFKEVLADKGATFIPHQESLLSGAISVGNTLLNPISGLSSVIEFITGATPLGTIVTKEGIRLALDANYNVIPEQSIREYDEGNVTTPVTRQKPLEKKKSTKKEEKKKDTTKKTGNTEKIKASNIDRLKSYMSLTGKDLSTSKKDLFITDISITEEDFT
jgi:hypothetical protein